MQSVSLCGNEFEYAATVDRSRELFLRSYSLRAG